MLQKTEDVNFMRDGSTSALINTNTAAYTLYKQQRNNTLATKTLEAEVHDLKTDINEIKQLLGQLIQNGSFNR